MRFLIVFCWCLIGFLFVEARSINDKDILLKALPDTIKIGVTDQYPPYEYVNEQNQLIGYNLDFVHLLMHELKVPYKIIREDYATIKKHLLNHKIDLYCYLFKTDKRKEIFTFSYPHLHEKCHFIVPKSSPYFKVKDLINKKIFVLKHSFTKEYLKSLMLNNQIIVKENVKEMITALKQRKGDALIMDCAAFHSFSNDFKTAMEYRIIAAMLQPKEICLVTAKGREQFMDAVNYGLYQLEFSGKLKKLHHLWFDTTEETSFFLSLLEIGIIIALVIFILIGTFLRIRQQIKRNRYYSSFIRSMINQMPFPVAVFDITDERNLEKAQLVASSKNRINLSAQDLNQSLKSILIKKDARKILHQLQQVIYIQKSLNEYTKVRFLSGKELVILIHGSVSKYKGRNYFLCYVIDRTELFKAKRYAEQVDKERRVFIKNMSHEIRTPLNAILGFSQMLVEKITNKERQNYIEIIKHNNLQLQELVNNILELSQLEAGMLVHHVEPLDVTEIFTRQVALLTKNNVKPKIRLKVDQPYLYCRTQLDEKCLSSVLKQFILNALKFTEAGEIRLGYIVKETTNELIFYCQDTGKGISPKELPTIFDYFKKLDTFTTGTGLGLTLSRAYVQLQKGKLGVYSNQKKSIFWCSYVLSCDYELSKTINKKEVESILNDCEKGIWYQFTSTGEFRLRQNQQKGTRR